MLPGRKHSDNRKDPTNSYKGNIYGALSVKSQKENLDIEDETGCKACFRHSQNLAPESISFLNDIKEAHILYIVRREPFGPTRGRGEQKINGRCASVIGESSLPHVLSCPSINVWHTCACVEVDYATQMIQKDSEHSEDKSYFSESSYSELDGCLKKHTRPSFIIFVAGNNEEMAKHCCGTEQAEGVFPCLKEPLGEDEFWRLQDSTHICLSESRKTEDKATQTDDTATLGEEACAVTVSEELACSESGCMPIFSPKGQITLTYADASTEDLLFSKFTENREAVTDLCERYGLCLESIERGSVHLNVSIDAPKDTLNSLLGEGILNRFIEELHDIDLLKDLYTKQDVQIKVDIKTAPQVNVVLSPYALQIGNGNKIYYGKGQPINDDHHTEEDAIPMFEEKHPETVLEPIKAEHQGLQDIEVTFLSQTIQVARDVAEELKNIQPMMALQFESTELDVKEITEGRVCLQLKMAAVEMKLKFYQSVSAILGVPRLKKVIDNQQVDVTIQVSALDPMALVSDYEEKISCMTFDRGYGSMRSRSESTIEHFNRSSVKKRKSATRQQSSYFSSLVASCFPFRSKKAH